MLEYENEHVRGPLFNGHPDSLGGTTAEHEKAQRQQGGAEAHARTDQLDGVNGANCLEARSAQVRETS